MGEIIPNENRIGGPPRWADRILGWFCSEKVVETLQGDLHELYLKRRQAHGKMRADFYFILEVMDVCRPFALKRKLRSNSNYKAMFHNYFKIAWRNLFKYRMYSTIKIGGFAIGITAFLLISMFVIDELSYDKHYTNSNRIYRVISENLNPADFWKGTALPTPSAQVIRDKFPEVEKVGRMVPFNGWFDAGSNQFRKENMVQNTFEEGFIYMDQELLEILEIPMIYGHREHALTKVNSMVLSRRKAEKYFPNQDPVGQIVILNDDTMTPFVIGGVMEDFPTNSHLQADFLITMTGKEFWPGEQTSWCCWNYHTYVLLSPDADPEEFEKKLLLLTDYVSDYRESQGFTTVKDTRDYLTFSLQLVSDIHLKSQGIHDYTQHGDMEVVVLFIVIAGFILLLACINFINLSTAKSANRAKEVGLRKVVGSFRFHLVQQFLVESIVVSTISVLVGVVVTFTSLPYFNVLADKSLALPTNLLGIVSAMVAFILVIGVLAGIYPSFYLSAFKPIDVLKGSLSRGSKSSRLRGVMVVFQFTTSIVLIVGAFVVQQQMDYMLNKRLGYDKEQVLLVRGTNTLEDKIHLFKEKLNGLSDVKIVSISDYIPVDGASRNGNMFWRDGRKQN